MRATLSPHWSSASHPTRRTSIYSTGVQASGTLGANNAEAAPAPRHGLDAPGWLRDDDHGFVFSESGLDAWNS